MLFGYVVDILCEMLISGIAWAAVAFVVACIVILTGEKMKWW